MRTVKMQADRPKARRDFMIFRLIDFINRGQMLLRNDEDMHRRLGIDVTERVRQIVLIDFRGGNFTADDFAEQTIVHGNASFLR